MLSWLRGFLGWTRRLEGVRVVLYTREGCHLCEDAWALLEEERGRYGFQLQTVDIKGDENLTREFGEVIPVVAIDGKVRFRGTVNRVLLRRLLDAQG